LGDYALSKLGWAKLQVGDMAGAEAAFKAGLEANQKDPSCLHGLGKMALMGQQFEVAVVLLGQASKIVPENEPLALDFVNALAGEAVKHPESADAQFNLGMALLGLGDVELARDTLLCALLADPSHVQSRWMVNRLLPRVYANQAEINVWRRRLFAGVAALEAAIKPQTPAEAWPHVQGLLTRTNFELAYQAEDDKPLQELYGRLVHRVMTAWLPDLAEPPEKRSFEERDDKRIRIGFASSYFTSHTISLMFGGFLKHLDRSRFLLFGYLTNGTPDSSTKVLAGLCHQFRDLRGDVGEAARAIRADELDVLVYPDVGMDGRGQALAALKLAPLQIAGMGHPVTTGLSSIDYFITSDLMEPDDGEKFYSEKLIRLPNTSFSYRPAMLAQTKSRADFGLAAGETVYLCCQAQQKYLPQFDRVFPAIAKKVGQARFVFIKHRARHLDNRRFQARIERVFKLEGLDPARHLLFLPWQDWTDFLQLNGVCDVFLDSIGWSGGNTSMEALSRTLPIVTLPTNLMRGRHAYVMLKVMGLDDCIVRDLESYVEVAAMLGTDQAFNAQIRARIKTGHAKLYDDLEPIRALEGVIEERVGASP
jgi:predicted O-linked N-acetylglucosamine transferase (SPINDLY family)